MFKRLISLSLTFLLTATCLLSLSASAESEKITPEKKHTVIAKSFASFFPREHLTRNKLNNTISSMSWTNFISSLDYERIYFLKSDIEKFKKKELLLDDLLKTGDVSFAYDVFHIFKQRIADRHQYVSTLLEQGLDTESNEKYVWQRKNQPWPKDKEDWDRIWRQKVTNEYIQQILAKERSEEVSETTLKETITTNITIQIAPTNIITKTIPTNIVVEASVTTNILSPTATNGAPLAPPLSPKEIILKRHDDMMTVMNDNDAEWVLQKYLSAFCYSFDPHSGYMSPSSMEDFDIEMKLSLVGIGALLRAEDGAAQIVKTIAGGPADRDARPIKLVPGDKIIAVGQGDKEPVNILHWPLYKVVQLIRGEKGTRVVLIVIPASDPTGSTTKTVVLVRDEVRLEEAAAKWKTMDIEDSQKKNRKLGVITLPTFYSSMNIKDVNDPNFRSSAYDVRKLIATAQEDNVDGLLLDLRNNGGGSLLEAIMLTGLFIPKGPVVQVKERYWTKSLHDREPETAYPGPLVVLVNMNSASASEILAGALQDYGRALIVGDSKTHGKGTVQTIMQLDAYNPSLGSVRITTASYYRISGGSTQLKGITPDIIIPSPWEYLSLDERTLNNPMPWSMVPPVNFKKDNYINGNIGKLANLSINRLANDSLYKAYTNQLERIRIRIEAREVSLNIEERRKQSKTDDELSKLQDELSTMDEDEKNSKSDMVLTESLRILADLADIQAKRPTVEAEKPTQKRKPLLNSILDWMLNV